jgi:hypothetical protein
MRDNDTKVFLFLRVGLVSPAEHIQHTVRGVPAGWADVAWFTAREAQAAR